MNFRFTAILFGIVFVLGVVLLVMSFTGDDKPPTDALAEELIAIKPEEIDVVEFERDSGSKVKLVRESGGKRWNITEPFTAKAETASVDDLVKTLLKAKPTTYPGLSSDPAAHGLQPPGIRVTLRAGERSSTINFGDVTIGGNKAVVFVTTSARPKRPMAVPRGMVDALFREAGGSGKAGDLAKWANDFRVRSVFAADTRGGGDDVAAITLTYKNHTLALERGSGINGAWKFLVPQDWGYADPVGDPASAGFTGVSRLLGALTNMQALSPNDFVDNPTPQQLIDYGLNDNNPDRIKVELRNRDKETTIAFIGKKDVAAAPPTIPGAPPSGKWWVQVQGQAGVIRANASDISGLVSVIENPDPLRDRTLLTLDKSRIDGIDLANGAVKLRKIGTWKMYGNPAAGDPTAVVGADKILDVLTQPRTIKSFPAPNPANFEGGTTVRVWADGFESNADPKVEPKEKSKPVVLTFGKKEGDAINVRRVAQDEKTTDYFLLPEKVKIPNAIEPADVLTAMTKSRLDLLDPALKTFAGPNVSKLTVTGTANYELDRDEKPDSLTGLPAWRFAKPDDRKGQVADSTTVGDMITTLGTTTLVSRFIDENPDAGKLAEYGLGQIVGRAPMPGDPPAPRLKVVVGLRDSFDPADKERVYEFGKETADPAFVYARQAGRTTVFTLPKSLADKFGHADLQDRQLFRFDPGQATSIKLRGWKAAAGFFVDLQFDKNKEGVWTVVKSPPGYNVDPAKVNAFLGELSRARVKEFLKGPPTAAMGFGDEKESFNAHITIPNHPDIDLNVWSPTDGGAAYFAGSSNRPPTDPVIKLDAAPFKPYKDSSAAFAK
jgi:Domain of unknown function (DUF4340)